MILLSLAMACVLAQSSAVASPLPIKPGSWKLTAVVHRAEGSDVTQTFFACNQATDLAHLVPQPSNLPANMTCAQDAQEQTATGEKLVFTCKSPSSTVRMSYDLTRASDTLVTGTMQMTADVGTEHNESKTSITYQWQQAECPGATAAAPPASK